MGPLGPSFRPDPSPTGGRCFGWGVLTGIVGIRVARCVATATAATRLMSNAPGPAPGPMSRRPCLERTEPRVHPGHPRRHSRFRSRSTVHRQPDRGRARRGAGGCRRGDGRGEALQHRRRRQRRVRRLRDPGARGPRGRAQAPGHVHRLDRRARTPPPHLGDRRQRRRRGTRGLRDPDRADAPGRRRRPGRGQRSRHPDRHGPGAGHARAHDGPDDAPRRRQVRRRWLQGLRRPPRRRRLGGQRALLAPGRGGQEPRPPVAPVLPARRARCRPRAGPSAGARARAPARR